LNCGREINPRQTLCPTLPVCLDLLSLTTWRPEPPLHSSTHDETATKQQTDKQRSVPVRLVRLRGSKDSSPERVSSTSLWLRSYSQTAAI